MRSGALFGTELSAVRQFMLVHFTVVQAFPTVQCFDAAEFMVVVDVV